MNKLKQLKEAMKQTPPDRLAKIEYQSHFMQMIGVSAVCSILIFKGFWWIIFAFIFSLGVSFSQFISAYQKYHAIKDIIGDTYNYKKDKSFTRKRSYIINKNIGWTAKVFSGFFAAIFCLYLIPYSTWYFKILFMFSFIVFYLLLYFFPFYWLAGGEEGA